MKREDSLLLCSQIGQAAMALRLALETVAGSEGAVPDEVLRKLCEHLANAGGHHNTAVILVRAETCRIYRGVPHQAFQRAFRVLADVMKQRAERIRQFTEAPESDTAEMLAFVTQELYLADAELLSVMDQVRAATADDERPVEAPASPAGEGGGA